MAGEGDVFEEGRRPQAKRRYGAPTDIIPVPSPFSHRFVTPSSDNLEPGRRFPIMVAPRGVRPPRSALAHSVAFPVAKHFRRTCRCGRTSACTSSTSTRATNLSQDMVDKLKVGQSPQQVKVILGTPLVTSVFPARPVGLRLRIQARAGQGNSSIAIFTVYFVDGKGWARWEGDEDAAVGGRSQSAGPSPSRFPPRSPAPRIAASSPGSGDIFKK